MNHIQMLRIIQDNRMGFSFEMRNMLEHINNELDLHKSYKELEILLEFTKSKIQDTEQLNKMSLNNNNNNFERLLLEKIEEQ